jgi:hypothetical protein
MVSTTEGIGRLIAEEVLLRSERQLLQNRDRSEQKPQDQPTPPTQSATVPISYNDRAVSSVLLTLLDEQIGAAEIEASRLSNFAPTSDGGAIPAAGRVAAQYAEVDPIFRPDTPAQQTALPAAATNQQVLMAAGSPELRMAMQSAFFSAAVRAPEAFSIASDGEARRQKIADSVRASSLMRIGAGAGAAIVLATFLAVSFTR